MGFVCLLDFTTVTSLVSLEAGEMSSVGPVRVYFCWWLPIPVFSCEQQSDKGWSILKDRGVLHTQALLRILQGNGFNIFQPGRG